jgi:hypothetical protein
VNSTGVVTANLAVGKVTASLSGGAINCGNGGSACGPTTATIGSNNKVNAIPALNYSFVRWVVNGVAQPAGWDEIINVAGSTAITVNAVFRYTPPALSCVSVTPLLGEAPLAVLVQVSDGVPPYTYTMGSNPPIVRNVTTLYYTFDTGGVKTITVSDSLSPTPTTCTLTVTVNAPATGSGGEVAP